MFRTTTACIVFGAFFASASPAAAQRTEQARTPQSTLNEMVRRENTLQYDRFRQEQMAPKGFIASGYKISRGEEKLLVDLEKKIGSKDPSTGIESAAKASASVRSPDARFLLGALQLQLAAKLNDQAMQAKATDLVIESGVTPPAMLPQLLQNQAVFALDGKDLAKAETAYGRLVELMPADADAMASLAQIKADAGKPREALPLFDRAIRLKTSLNQPVPNVWLQAEQATRAQLTAGTKH